MDLLIFVVLMIFVFVTMSAAICCVSTDKNIKRKAKIVLAIGIVGLVACGLALKLVMG